MPGKCRFRALVPLDAVRKFNHCHAGHKKISSHLYTSVFLAHSGAKHFSTGPPERLDPSSSFCSWERLFREFHMPLLPEKRLPLLTRELCLAPLPQMSQLSFGPADGIVRTSGFRALCAAGLFLHFPKGKERDILCFCILFRLFVMYIQQLV